MLDTADTEFARPGESRAAVPTRGKIVSIDEAAGMCRAWRSRGVGVVLAHGVFDLLHVGHLRHLKLARREGDVLVVSLTADRFVNKGPGRPAFPAHARAEMVAALDIVDAVVVTEAAAATPTLGALRPDVYVKGSEYEDAAGDVTGKIGEERCAVESHGGRICFTDDEVHSSSSLINRFLEVHDPALRDHLAGMRRADGLRRVLAAIEQVADCRVLVVGDAIVDEYQYVVPMGKTPKEHLIATHYGSREIFAGGAIAAANHVASLCRSVDVVTCLGAGDPHEEMIRQSLLPNVTLRPVFRHGAPTLRKSRFIDSNHMRKLFEVYFWDEAPLGAALRAELDGQVAAIAGEYDVVIVTDFGHGLIAADTIAALQANARFLAVNAQTNSANIGFNLITKYARADYVCIDKGEALLATADRQAAMPQVLETLAARIPGARIMVTLAKDGCLGREPSGTLHGVPACTRAAIDTVGAGDAFLAVTAPLIARGVPLDIAGFVGNAAGALKVNIVGHRKSVEKAALIKYATALLK